MTSQEIRIVVLVSGGGSNLQAILDAAKAGTLSGGRVVLVISSRGDAYALERAKKHGVATAVIERKAYPTEEAFQTALLEKLFEARPDVVCLAGYVKKIGSGIVRRFRGRILNIHPALLPKHGGAGMYGHYVHEAVIASGDKESGCTIHLVDEDYDHGKVLAQAKVAVLPGDSPDALAARILEQEHQLYPKVLSEFCASLTNGGAAGANS